MIAFFCAWLRRFFAIDESRLRVRVYLHEGLDLDAAERFWSEVTGVPRAQFGSPYRAKADASIRTEQARTRLRVRRLLLFAGPIGRSWAWSGRCYPRAPFRGSSIGRANGLLTVRLRVRVSPPELTETLRTRLSHRGVARASVPVDGHERRGRLGDDGRRALGAPTTSRRSGRSTSRCGGSRR